MSDTFSGPGARPGPQSTPPASGGASNDVTTATFAADVIEASRTTPVIVDFWAPWCGPCRQLTPIIEKVAGDFRGRVILLKMNIDESPEIAGQLGVKSIPAVFAFKDGRPVDGFMGALPESQIRQFFDRIADAAAPGVAEALATADAALAAGDITGAAKTYAAVLSEDQQNTAAIAGLTKCYIEHREFEHAEKTLGLAPKEKFDDPDISSARAALELARGAQDATVDFTHLVARVESHPDDHAARVELATALNAAGEREGALDALIQSIRRDRAANDAAARKQLLTFFEAWGVKDPLTLSGRRQLSSILFS